MEGGPGGDPKTTGEYLIAHLLVLLLRLSKIVTENKRPVVNPFVIAIGAENICKIFPERSANYFPEQRSTNSVPARESVLHSRCAAPATSDG